MRQRYACTIFFLFLLSCNNNSQTEVTSRPTDSSLFHERMMALQKKYADPNSPFRDEQEAIKIYDSILASPWYSAAEKQAIQHTLKLAQQNRIGSVANDFTFYTPEGTAKKLYAIKSPYTLLYFYNPECNACKEMKAALVASSIITQKLHAGTLKLVAIYIDTDLSIWRTHLPYLPKEWIHGRDEEQYLWKNKVYDLRAIPTIYLLDKNKKVLLKDCTSISQLEEVLCNL
jgi:thioredoxin-related protein